MLNSNDFENMIRRYCYGEVLRYLDFWKAFNCCFDDQPQLIKYRLYAQHKEYLKVENHHIQIDVYHNMHQFLVIELTSDFVIDILKQYWDEYYPLIDDYYQLTEDDIDGIRAGLDNSYCEMRYYFISYDYYNEYGDSDYYNDEALYSDDFHTFYGAKGFKFFADKQKAIDYIYEEYLEEEWVIDEATSL